MGPRILPLCLFLAAAAAPAQFPQPNGGDLEPGTLPPHWMTGGPKCMEVPAWQVHEYNPDLYILRQSGCSDYEKPFLYLIFGKERGLLLDTGSRNGDLVPTLERTVAQWLERSGRASIPLIVTHSHAHSDHVAGDAQVQAMKNPSIAIDFVPARPADEKIFFAITGDADAHGSVDLGGRVIDVIPIPGHDEASIALYDRGTGLLLTGDSLYPGRLYIHDLAEFERSTDRLIRFTATRPVAHILGCHIEQTSTPFLDYPIGTIYQPEEHRLEMSRGDLLLLGDALRSLHGKAERLAMSDFTLWPVAAGDYSMSAQTRAVFERTQKQQLENRWNQPGP